MQRRILRAIFGLIALIALFFFVVNFVTVRRSIQEYNAVHAQAHTELIPSLLTLHYASQGGWEGVEFELIRLNVLAGTKVTIVDLNGVVVTSTGDDDIGAVYQLRPEVSQVFEILDPGGGPVATAYVETALASQTIDQTFFQNLVQGLIISIAVAIIIGMLVGTILTRSVVQPIQYIEQAARQLAFGAYETRIEPSHREDEIDSLAQTFNQMADGLQATETLRRRLVADLSHDLKTPLTVLKGYLEGLLNGQIRDRQTALQIFSRMSTEIDYLDELVTSLSTSASWDSGKLVPSYEGVSLQPAVEAVVGRLEPLFAEQQNRVESRIEPATLNVQCDRQMLDQLLYNLIFNASAHNPVGTTILVEAIQDRDTILLRIEDDGQGIPAPDQARIFERFVRLDSARNRKQGGTGLGLSIVKSIVEAHAAQIAVESPLEDGRGSAFVIRFRLPTPQT